MWQCAVRFPLSTARRGCGGSQREFHCLWPPGGDAVCCRTPTARGPRAVQRCLVGVPLPTTPRAMRQCFVEVGQPTAPKQYASPQQEFHYPPPLGVGLFVAGVPLPTAPKRRRSVPHAARCTRPPGSEAVSCTSSTAHCP